MMQTKLRGWTWKRLNELGFVGRGKSRHRPRNEPRLYGGPYPFIQTADIMAADPYITSYSQTYSEFGLRQSKMWPVNTLCMTIAGANTAKVAILKIPACFPDSVVGFIPDKSKTDLHFVLYSLGLMKDQFLAVSRGATQDNLGLNKLLSFPLLVPGISQQRKIASILLAYDELIENNNRRIALLEKMTEDLYREWFVRFRFPNHEKVKIVRGISSDWTVCEIGARFSTVLGGTPSREEPSYWAGHIPWINSGEINKLRIIEETEFITENGLRHSAAKIMPMRTTVIAITGATLGQVSLTEIEVCANQSVVGIYDSTELYREYCYQFVRTNIMNIIAKQSGGGQQHINKEIIQKETILLPPASLMKQYNRIICPFFDQIRTLLVSNKTLKKLRDFLLPHLISGKLSVENLNIQFPPGTAEELATEEAAAAHA